MILDKFTPPSAIIEPFKDGDKDAAVIKAERKGRRPRLDPATERINREMKQLAKNESYRKNNEFLFGDTLITRHPEHYTSPDAPTVIVRTADGPALQELPVDKQKQRIATIDELPTAYMDEVDSDPVLLSNKSTSAKNSTKK